jgi:hypothetical protein
MSQAQQFKNLFELFPGKEFSLPELATSIGAYAVHSRVAELRTKHGMTIVNRRERKDGKEHSYYTYHAVAAPQAESVPATQAETVTST